MKNHAIVIFFLNEISLVNFDENTTACFCSPPFVELLFTLYQAKQEREETVGWMDASVCSLLLPFMLE